MRNAPEHLAGAFLLCGGLQLPLYSDAREPDTLFARILIPAATTASSWAGSQTVGVGGQSIAITGGLPRFGPIARVGRRDVGRGEAVRDGWLRFQLDDADYRQLAHEGVSAICTVDRQTGDILGVRFIG
jgi:hypothetical protein